MAGPSHVIPAIRSMKHFEKVIESDHEYLIILETRLSQIQHIVKYAKKHNIIGVQRLFALDSHALDQHLTICNKVSPDFIEVLPGIVPEIIAEVKNRTGVPVLAGGLVRKPEEVQRAIEAGAEAITTSHSKLWRL